MPKTIAIIPARLESTRLPRKALADIAGQPMIAHVVKRVLLARGLAGVYVATDSGEIAQAAEKAGARVVMTSKDCASGTDRVAEASRMISADLILNIQGDEPLLSVSAVEDLAALLASAKERGVELATLARPLLSEEANSPQVVKVVCSELGDALYFSRSLIPFPRAEGKVRALAHVGLYGYTPNSLARLAALPPTGLELAEGLEQLRALGHGMPMAVGVSDYSSVAVDTPEDLERVRGMVAGLEAS